MHGVSEALFVEPPEAQSAVGWLKLEPGGHDEGPVYCPGSMLGSSQRQVSSPSELLESGPLPRPAPYASLLYKLGEWLPPFQRPCQIFRLKHK